MSFIKRIAMCLAVMLIISISYVVSGYSSANVINNTKISIVDSGDAILAIPNNQVIEINSDNPDRITVVNNTSKSLKIYVPKIANDHISIEGKPDIILPGNLGTIPNYKLEINVPDSFNDLVEITVIAESLDGNFTAEVKSSVRIINN